MDVTQILENRSYTKLLYGSYSENPTWVEFMNCITEVFNENFGKQLIQLVNVNVPHKSTREINIGHAKNMGFDLKNSFFSNEEYIALIENLKLYEKKKGTKHFISILGLIKSAHFNIYQLWTSDYIDFERESQWVLNNSILKDYNRIVNNYIDKITYGIVNNKATSTISYGLVADKSTSQLTYGIINEFTMGKNLPDINNPNYYKGKYYPTSHVDIDYDIEKYPISESDIRYLFYKLAPANLVLNMIDGVIYVDSAYLYMTALANLEQSYDTFIGWAMYEGTLYTYPFDFLISHDITSPVLYYKLDNEDKKKVNCFDKSWYSLPSGFTCVRSSKAWYVEKEQLKEVESNTIRFIDNKGILLEPKSTNLLKNSNVFKKQHIILKPNTYTLSFYGREDSYLVLSGLVNTQIKTNEPYTFKVGEEGSLYITPYGNVFNIQLEESPFATSQIITSDNTYQRTTDVYVSTNTTVLDSTCFFKFTKNKDNRLSYLFSYGSGFNDTLDVYYDSKLYIEQILNNNKQKTEIEWNGEGEIGFELRLDSKANNFVLKVVLNNKVTEVPFTLGTYATAFRLGADWFGNNGLNGYLTYLLSVDNRIF